MIVSSLNFKDNKIIRYWIFQVSSVLGRNTYKTTWLERNR